MLWSDSTSRPSSQISISSPRVALQSPAAGAKISYYTLPLVIIAFAQQQQCVEIGSESVCLCVCPYMCGTVRYVDRYLLCEHSYRALEQERFPLAALLHGQIRRCYSLSLRSCAEPLNEPGALEPDTFTPKSSTARLKKLPHISLWSPLGEKNEQFYNKRDLRCHNFTLVSISLCTIKIGEAISYPHFPVS